GLALAPARRVRPDERYPLDLATAPPSHVLLGVLNTVVCVDADCLREVSRARELNDVLDPAEADAIPEETLPPDGFAYDAAHRLLYMQCGYFEAAILLCYRFDEATRTFTRVFRSRVYESYVPSGLCVTPDGSGVAGSFLVEHGTVDLWGRPIRNKDERIQ